MLSYGEPHVWSGFAPHLSEFRARCPGPMAGGRWAAYSVPGALLKDAGNKRPSAKIEKFALCLSYCRNLAALKDPS